MVTLYHRYNFTLNAWLNIKKNLVGNSWLKLTILKVGSVFFSLYIYIDTLRFIGIFFLNQTYLYVYFIL